MVPFAPGIPGLNAPGSTLPGTGTAQDPRLTRDQSVSKQLNDFTQKRPANLEPYDFGNGVVSGPRYARAEINITETFSPWQHAMGLQDRSQSVLSIWRYDVDAKLPAPALALYVPKVNVPESVKVQNPQAASVFNASQVNFDVKSLFKDVLNVNCNRWDIATSPLLLKSPIPDINLPNAKAPSAQDLSQPLNPVPKLDAKLSPVANEDFNATGPFRITLNQLTHFGQLNVSGQNVPYFAFTPKSGEGEPRKLEEGSVGVSPIFDPKNRQRFDVFSTYTLGNFDKNSRIFTADKAGFNIPNGQLSQTNFFDYKQYVSLPATARDRDLTKPDNWSPLGLTGHLWEWAPGSVIDVSMKTVKGEDGKENRFRVFKYSTDALPSPVFEELSMAQQALDRDKNAKPTDPVTGRAYEHWRVYGDDAVFYRDNLITASTALSDITLKYRVGDQVMDIQIQKTTDKDGTERYESLSEAVARLATSNDPALKKAFNSRNADSAVLDEILKQNRELLTYEFGVWKPTQDSFTNNQISSGPLVYYPDITKRENNRETAFMRASWSDQVGLAYTFGGVGKNNGTFSSEYIPAHLANLMGDSRNTSANFVQAVISTLQTKGVKNVREVDSLSALAGLGIDYTKFDLNETQARQLLYGIWSNAEGINAELTKSKEQRYTEAYINTLRAAGVTNVSDKGISQPEAPNPDAFGLTDSAAEKLVAGLRTNASETNRQLKKEALDLNANFPSYLNVAEVKEGSIVSGDGNTIGIKVTGDDPVAGTRRITFASQIDSDRMFSTFGLPGTRLTVPHKPGYDVYQAVDLEIGRASCRERV
jgi:hypothetical protein